MAPAGTRGCSSEVKKYSGWIASTEASLETATRTGTAPVLRSLPSLQPETPTVNRSRTGIISLFRRKRQKKIGTAISAKYQANRSPKVVSSHTRLKIAKWPSTASNAKPRKIRWRDSSFVSGVRTRKRSAVTRITTASAACTGSEGEDMKETPNPWGVCTRDSRYVEFGAKRQR